MIPNAVVLVPQYVLTQQLGWLSTYQGMIVPEAAVTFPSASSCSASSS
jgi:ABC-type glycerol-3-phosphate transport system permease component